MKSTAKTLWLSVLLIVFGLSLASAAHADNQDLCKFDANIMKGPMPVPRPPGGSMYYPWKALGPGDQGIVRPCPACPGQHSGLVGWVGNIDDDLFAKYIGATVARGPYTQVPLVFVFGQCYSGGMIDDLARANLPNPMSIVSASFFNQTASYPIKGGNGMDFVWAYVQALTTPNITAFRAAAQAAKDNPFGWNPNPNPARMGETLGSETAEYYEQNFGGAVVLITPKPMGNARVILWSGHPKQVDDRQLANIFVLLLQAGYAKENIVALFASGTPKNSVLANTMRAAWNPNNPLNGMNGASHLRAATEKQLGFTLANWVFPAGNQPNNFIFDFVATDHGCNNAFEATAESGDGGDAIEDGGDYGEGDGDDDIYP